MRSFSIIKLAKIIFGFGVWVVRGRVEGINWSLVGMLIGYNFLEENLGSDLKTLKNMPICFPKQFHVTDIIVDV